MRLMKAVPAADRVHYSSSRTGVAESSGAPHALQHRAVLKQSHDEPRRQPCELQQLWRAQLRREQSVLCGRALVLQLQLRDQRFTSSLQTVLLEEQTLQSTEPTSDSDINNTDGDFYIKLLYLSCLLITHIQMSIKSSYCAIV